MLRLNYVTHNLEIVCDHCKLPIPRFQEGVVQAELELLPDGSYSEYSSDLVMLHVKCIGPYLRSFSEPRVGCYTRDNLERAFSEVNT